MCGKMGGQNFGPPHDGGKNDAISPKPHFRLKNPIFLAVPPHHGGGTAKNMTFFGTPHLAKTPPPHDGGGRIFFLKSAPPIMGGDQIRITTMVWANAGIFPPPLLNNGGGAKRRSPPHNGGGGNGTYG